MNNSERLYKLGLFVRRTGTGIEADLPLDHESLVNPMTGMRIEQATFMVVSDRLMALDPPEMVGLPPIGVTDFDTAGQLRNWVVADFKRMLAELEKRSAELRSLGIPPKVDPETLHLTAEVKDGELRFELSSDKRGNFRIARAEKGGNDLAVPGTQTFELSEYPELPQLIRHLSVLVGLPVGEEPKSQVRPLGIADVAHYFGGAAMVPPKSALELLVEFRARGRVYRFAAARVQGRTFRGLLAGPEGKLWADRFELEQFPGIPSLAAHVLGISEGEVEFNSRSEA